MNKSLADIDIQKLYIVTRPTRVSELQLEDFDAMPDNRAVKRGRKLRDRRLARIREQFD